MYQCIGLQVQAMQGFCNALLPVPAVQCFNFALHGVEVTVPAGVGFNQVNHASQAGAYRCKYAGLRIQHRFLRHIGHADVVLELQAAIVGLFKPG